jgi:hypothetical protein
MSNLDPQPQTYISLNYQIIGATLLFVILLYR